MFLPEARFGLRVLSLPASVCPCVRVLVCPCVCVSITDLDVRYTLKCDIYKFNGLKKIDVVDTLRFNNVADFLYRLPTALGMRPSREYWWSTKQPQVTDLRWQLGFQWHRRGIELVFKSLDCFTKRLLHTATIFAATYVFVVWNFTRLITRLKKFFLPRFGGGALSSNLFAPYTDL